MQEKRAKKRYRQGKQLMVRSRKESFKREKTPPKIDPEEMAWRLYLGPLGDEVDQTAQKK